jgi:D-tyrosyl-tRNA(Tyr) deacylase
VIVLLQRVQQASVHVSGQCMANINQGILALVGVQSNDNEATAEHFITRIINYRLFTDDQGKMNLSLVNIEGGLLLVPQFTLAANTSKGRRPGFTSAAQPALGESVFQSMEAFARNNYALVEAGLFGADMAVHLINDGPVTFILD